MKRRFVGAEFKPELVEIAKARLAATQAKMQQGSMVSQPQTQSP